MSPTSCSCGTVRSAAVVNAHIRELVDRARFEGRPVDRDAYWVLLEEWHDAMQREMVTAA
jgi:hypothetical protein